MTAATGQPTATRPALRHRLAERGIDRALLLLVPGLIFIAVLFLYPFLYGVGLSFSPQQGGGPFANYRKFFDDPYLRNTLWTTFRLALPAALINVLASIPMAYKLRRPFRGKRTLTTLLVVPITLGTVLTAEGLLEYLAPAGWLNKTLLALHLIDQPIELVHNYWGVLFSLIITGFPFAFLLTMSYLSGIDPTLESAAATLGAGWRERFRFITLPLLAPGLAITFCLSFVLAFSVFPSAFLVGDPSGRTRVISIAAYHAALEQFDFSLGSTIAVIMTVAMLIVIAAVLAWRGTLYKGASGGKG
ncbi:MAG: ABC transporter permease [Pseudonocardiales bacterium]|nr:MAG: ABC transporter permease [Pseudonocardiales bacterium]